LFFQCGGQWETFLRRERVDPLTSRGQSRDGRTRLPCAARTGVEVLRRRSAAAIAPCCKPPQAGQGTGGDEQLEEIGEYERDETCGEGAGEAKRRLHGEREP
jgi:hypothetical protein